MIYSIYDKSNGVQNPGNHLWNSSYGYQKEIPTADAVHPDTEAFSTRAYDFTAQEINEAYDFLRKNMPEESLEKADKNTTSSRKQHGKLLTASLKALFHFHPGRSDESHMAAPP